MGPFLDDRTTLAKASDVLVHETTDSMDVKVCISL
jgi:hypothetical protein